MFEELVCGCIASYIQSYRSRGLTSIVCKLLESLIRDVVLSFLERHNKSTHPTLF